MRQFAPLFATSQCSQSLARTSGLTRCWLTSAKVSNHSNNDCNGHIRTNLRRNRTNGIMLAAALCALPCATRHTPSTVCLPLFDEVPLCCVYASSQAFTYLHVCWSRCVCMCMHVCVMCVMCVIDVWRQRKFLR